MAARATPWQCCSAWRPSTPFTPSWRRARHHPRHPGTGPTQPRCAGCFGPHQAPRSLRTRVTNRARRALADVRAAPRLLSARAHAAGWLGLVARSCQLGGGVDRQLMPRHLPRWSGVCISVGLAVWRDPACQGGAAARAVRGRLSLALHRFMMTPNRGNVTVSTTAVRTPQGPTPHMWQFSCACIVLIKTA